MKSIRTKFILFVIGCLIVSCSIVGGAGILTSREVVNEDSSQIMNLLCLKEAQNINALLSRIEQSVQTLAAYAAIRMDDSRQLQLNPAYAEAYMNAMESVAVNAAKNTEGALAVYIRFNPNLFPPTSGFWFTRTAFSFEKNTPTDFSQYAEDDMEHVGWFYIPARNKQATWLAPYLNKNVNIWMISYVIPVYVDGTLMGVVGMDIDFNVLKNMVGSIRVYENGYAFLVKNAGRIVYHPDLEMDTALSTDPTDELSGLVRRLLKQGGRQELFTYTYRDISKEMTFQNLHNGLKLVLAAPSREINARAHSLLLEIGIFSFLILILFCVLTFLAATKIVRPLRELNIAAQKIAAGDLSISITHQSADEVGALADSFRQTVQHLQKYITYINGLAYRDALTGCKNRTAYLEAASRFDEQIRLKRPSFGVVIFDLNNLKELNDTCGHDFGDMQIINTAKIICHIFKRSPVYRIGGDEFTVILENNDLQHYLELLTQFQNAVEEWNNQPQENIHLSIARGIAIFDDETDFSFHDVFKRADDAMYQNKAEMKQRQARSRLSLEISRSK